MIHYPTFHAEHHRRHAIIVSAGLAIVTALLFAAAVIAGANIESIVRNLAISSFRVLVAYVISLFLAVAIGIAVTRNARVEEAALPVLDVLQSFPNFALLPIAIAWLGAGSAAMVFILVITMIWPILFAVVAGAKNIRNELSEAAKIFGARGWRSVRQFLVPALFPAMVSGSIVGWGEGWEAIVGTEIIAKGSGIGTEIFRATEQHETRLLIIMLLILMYLIFLINTWVWLALLRKATQRSE